MPFNHHTRYQSDIELSRTIPIPFRLDLHKIKWLSQSKQFPTQAEEKQ